MKTGTRLLLPSLRAFLHVPGFPPAGGREGTSSQDSPGWGGFPSMRVLEPALATPFRKFCVKGNKALLLYRKAWGLFWNNRHQDQL